MSNDKPEIIILDLETMPDLTEILKVWPSVGDYPGKTLRATITTIICAGYKYLDEKTTHCLNVWDYSKNINDDKRLVKALYEILKDADAIVTHNGKRFDWKFLQTRLMVHGLPPLNKIPHIDTCGLAKENLFLYNNRLGTLGEFLADDNKIQTGGWELWVDCYKGDKKARKKMSDYCKQDVKLTEKVFKPLRPFATNLPNYNLYVEDKKKVCPTCGSNKLKSHGLHRTKTKVYRRYRCRNCNSYSRVDMRGLNARSVK